MNTWGENVIRQDARTHTQEDKEQNRVQNKEGGGGLRKCATKLILSISIKETCPCTNIENRDLEKEITCNISLNIYTCEIPVIHTIITINKMYVVPYSAALAPVKLSGSEISHMKL